MLPLIHIYSDNPLSPRLQYVVQVVIEEHWKVRAAIHTQRSSFEQAKGPRIWYSREEPPTGLSVLRVPVSPFLQQPFSPAARPEVQEWTSGNEVPFDIFAGIFFWLSRWEEYASQETDAHGRMPGSKSYAAQSGWLQKPIVDEWSNQLGAALQRVFPTFSILPYGYHFLPTYDIDQAWCYQHKGWKRNLGGMLRDLLKADFPELGRRTNILFGKQPDPFDQFDLIQQWHRETNLPAIFFWLLGTRGPFDKNTSSRHPALRQLIRQMDAEFSTGLHPSYASGDQPEKILQELNQLQSIVGQPVTKSRQHFLRLSWPATYQQLLQAGIQSDYSMGFADQLGFRAGTARPFYWYDLMAEQPTRLRITPFQLMDVTARQYLQLSPEETLEKAKAFAATIQQTGGQFVTLWHNSSLSHFDDWGPWRDIYLQILQECR
jgi:hypothetical protein